MTMKFENSLNQAVRNLHMAPNEQIAVQNLGDTILDGTRRHFPFVNANCNIHSVGSTARGTQDLAPALPDFDIWITFNDTGIEPFVHVAQEGLPKFAQFVHDSAAFKEFCKWFLPGVVNITLECEAFRPFPRSIPNPENYIGKVHVSKQPKDRELLIDIGMVPTDFMKSGVNYTDAFLTQAASWPDAERAEILANIRLFKTLCKHLDIYNRRSGGVRSIGVEQLVIQSGGRLADLMKRIYNYSIVYDNDSSFAIKPFDSVVANWLVVNPGFDRGHVFYNVLNFLDRSTQNTGNRDGDRNWLKLATLARTFQRMKADDEAWTIESFVSRVQSTSPPMIDNSKRPQCSATRIIFLLTILALVMLLTTLRKWLSQGNHSA